MTALVTALYSSGCHAPKRKVVTAVDTPPFRAAEAMDRFGYDLLARLLAQEKSGGNVFISPFSVMQAMMVAANGAGGTSRAAFLSTLHLSSELDAANQEQADIRRKLLEQAKGESAPEIVIANALWADRKFVLAPAYVDTCHRFYSAEATTLDFGHPDLAADAINTWVSKNTKGRISSIISPANLIGPPPAQAILTNAVYFKARWNHEFWKNDTKPEPFTLSTGAKKPVPMMQQIGAESFAYLEGDGFTSARLWYVGGASMYILLPDPGSTPIAVLEKLRTSGFGRWKDRWDNNIKMDLYLPRFRTEYSAGLVPPLAAMGLRPALSSDADFSPMGLRGAFVGEILHKTFVSVDEEGTEAAAATAIIGAGGMAPPQQEKRKVVFRVDRPFLLAVVDNHTDALLFVGVINDPTR